MKLEFVGKTKAKVFDSKPQTKKEGQTDSRPAGWVQLKILQPNSALKMLDKNLQTMLFEKGPSKQLDGIDQVSELNRLTPIAENMGPFKGRVYHLVFAENE